MTPSIEEIADGWNPDLVRTTRGPRALDLLLDDPHGDQTLYKALAMLELYIATGGASPVLASARGQARLLAIAVRQVMKDG